LESVVESTNIASKPKSILK